MKFIKEYGDIWFTILMFGIGFILAIYLSIDSINRRDTTIKELTNDINTTTQILEVSTMLNNYLVNAEMNRVKEVNKIYSIMHTKDLTKAEITQRAAKEYDIDSLLLTVLINSESSYKDTVKHNHQEVKGIGGIHTKYWKIPNETIEQQIYASALVLRILLDKYEGDILKALKAYKGWSDLGERRAKKVIADYNSVKE